VIGILRNWENESLLTVEEIGMYQKKQKKKAKSENHYGGRDIPSVFILDLTAGEDGRD
jgi:DNA replication protein DnaD